LLDEFATSFATITELQPALNGFEYNPQLAQAASGSDTVMVATFAMGVGAREGEATLVLPFSSFASALNNAASPQLSETALAKRRRAAEALTARLNLVRSTSACGSPRSPSPRPTSSRSPSVTSCCSATPRTARSRSPPTT